MKDGKWKLSASRCVGIIEVNDQSAAKSRHRRVSSTWKTRLIARVIYKAHRFITSNDDDIS